MRSFYKAWTFKQILEYFQHSVSYEMLLNHHYQNIEISSNIYWSVLSFSKCFHCNSLSIEIKKNIIDVMVCLAF